jgi:hypothetical protein
MRFLRLCNRRGNRACVDLLNYFVGDQGEISREEFLEMKRDLIG